MNENIWQNILREEQRNKKPIVISKWMIRMAAAAILIAVCTAAILFLANPPAKNQRVASLLNQQKENRLVYLKDGSSIILSPGSQLNYPPSFNDLDKREVYLEGEAFFNISHHPSKRFIVHTKKLEITVLGTAFNIKAFPGNADITVTVSRGKVKISANDKNLGLITRGQQIIYDKSRGNSIQKTVNADSNLAWKKQDLLLDDVTVGEAVKLLEDKFDVNISVSDSEIETKRFTTVFLRTESLEQVLRSICEFNGALYEYNKEKAIVTISKIKP